MHNYKRQKRRVCTAASATLGTVIVGVGAPAQADIEFTPSIEVGATWTDNVELSSQSKESEYVGQVTPGFSLRQQSRRIKSEIDYTLRSFFYEESSRDTSFHEARGSFDAEVIRNWFSVGAQGAYTQQIIDPTRPINNNFLFDVGNLTDTLSGSVTPRLRHEFDFTVLDASYTRGFLDYKQSADISNLTSDADTAETRVSLASPDDARLISWGADYSKQTTQFDTVAQRFQFERANAELGVGVTDSLRLIGRAGKETDARRNSTRGGLDESTWEAGFAYAPDAGTKLEAFYGKRFFGTSYRASARRDAQFLQLSATYDEGPVTQAQQLLSQPGAFQVPPIVPLDPGTNPIGTLTSDVFIAKNFNGTIGLTGRLTKINISALDERREFLNSPQRERVTGTRFTVIRNLSSRTDATVDLFFTDTKFRTGATFDEQSYRFSLTRTLSERLSANAMIGRVERSGKTGYTANFVNLGLKASF